MMAQYMETKKQYSDCILFYRLGDFYEMFFDDALTASKELEITLTGKECGLEERAPMCGVPYHAVDSYLSRLALGGGVVGDLCGFTAATYLRGIRFIQVPTTLLSQVDSSIGGKTGVDFDAYKNMVGAFHMPQLVYTAATSLLTLTEEQFACGMGEVIKHGLIMDADYYEWLQAHRKEILARDLSVCEQMILVSCRVKRDVVEQDPTEQGIRGILNFGHTLGHAIEKLMHFQLLHGQCVALGCVAAAGLSAKRGEITMEEALHIREVFADFGLPTAIADFGLSREEIIAATKNDKKMDSGRIKFILLHRVGEAFIDRTVTDEEMNTCLDWLMGGSDEDERI